MSCSPTTRHSALAPHFARDPGLRISERERQATQDLLAQAWSLGYLREDELDARLDRVVGAATVGDVDAVLADLPVHELRRRDPRARAARVCLARRSVWVHGVAAGAALVLMVGIWLAVAVGTGFWYPWPVWPLLGMSIGVACHGAAVRSFTTSQKRAW